MTPGALLSEPTRKSSSQGRNTQLGPQQGKWGMWMVLLGTVWENTMGTGGENATDGWRVSLGSKYWTSPQHQECPLVSRVTFCGPAQLPTQGRTADQSPSLHAGRHAAERHSDLPASARHTGKAYSFKLLQQGQQAYHHRTQAETHTAG